MHNRAKIPGLALLSLSLTDCVERSSGPDGDLDPIVGDWHAITVDGAAFPVLSSEGPYMVRSGLELRVSETLSGSFMLVTEVQYEDYLGRYEEGSTLVVDASGAPKYRIDIKHDPLGKQGYAEEGYYEPYETGPTSIGPDSDGYDSVGYDTEFTTGGDSSGSGGSSGGALGEPGAARPLQIPLAPRLAPAEMVLRCTLSGERLNCERDGDEEPKVLVFQRDEDD